MKNRTLKYIFSLMIFSVLLMVVGCGSGGGQGVAVQETPEAAVMRITDNWRASSNSPSVVVDENNRFIRQASEPKNGIDVESITVKPQSQNNNDNTFTKTITLFDLASNTYELKVLTVEKLGTTASVKCSFLYGSDGYLILLFTLEFDEGKWWLVDVEITDQKLEEGKAVYTVQHIRITPEGKYEIEQTIEVGDIGSTAYVTPKTTYQSYEFMSEHPDNKLSDTITEDGNMILKVYYKYAEKVEYLINYILLDANGKVVKEIPETNWGVIGSTYSVDTTKKIDDYVCLVSDKRNTLSGKIEAGKKLVLIVYYQYNKMADYTVRYLDSITKKEIEKTYTGSDVIGKTITIDAPTITDYVYSKESKNTGTVLEDGSLVITLYYDSKYASYTVMYLEYGTENEIQKSDVYEKADVGDKITVNAPTIKGYTYRSDSINYGEVLLDGSLVIKLYYEKSLGYEISGVVKDEKGNILCDATVQVFNASDLKTCIKETETDENGKYSVTVEELGTYILVITGEGYESQTIRVVVDGSNKDVRANIKL